MNDLKKIAFVILFFSSFSLFAQKGFINTPRELSKSCKSEFIAMINSGEISLESLYYPKRKRGRVWEVFSDRSNNLLYNSPNGSIIYETLDYMQPLYVKSIKGQWLNVYNTHEKELGWIKARNLILSKYSLLTNENIEIKKITINSIDHLISLEDAEKNRYFYSAPSTRSKQIIKSFENLKIYYVIKEQDGFVLLATSSFVNDNTSIVGWVQAAHTTTFNFNLFLIPSRSHEAKLRYKNEALHAFESQKKLENFIDRGIYQNNTSFLEFEVGSIFDSLGIDMVILNSISHNIKKVLLVYEKKAVKEAYVALDYGMGINALEHAVLFSNLEYDDLIKRLSEFSSSFDIMREENRRRTLYNTLISLFGKITHSHPETIGNLTINEIWNLLFSIDYPKNTVLKSTRLEGIKTEMDSNSFNSVIFDFELACRDFVANDYSNRMLEINGNIFYMIPLEDLPFM